MKWCNVNGMSLNFKKCKKLSLSLLRPLFFDYLIRSYKLDSVDLLVDFGVILDGKLHFNLHIESCVNKATSSLGL